MKKQFFRMVLMIAGVLTVLVILLSQTFYKPAESNPSKVKKEQKGREPISSVHISAPADVMPSPAIQMADNVPVLLKALIPDPENKKTFFPELNIVIRYFNILFRAIISPNAP